MKLKLKLKLIFILLLLVFSLSFFCSAASTVEELEKQLTISQDLDQAKILAELSLKLRMKNPEVAKKYAEKSLQLLLAFPHPETEVKSRNAIAWSDLLLGDFENAGKMAESAKTLASQIDNQLGIAFAINTLGVKIWFEGNLQTAKQLLASSLSIRLKENSIAEISTSYNNLGAIEQELGNFPLAIENHLQAIHYAELSEDNLLLANAFFNMGALNQELGNYDKALDYHQQVLDVYLELNNILDAAETYNNIAVTYIQMEQYNNSIDTLKLGLELLKDTEAPRQNKYLYSGLGSAYLATKELKKAYDSFITASQYPFDSVQTDVPLNSSLALVLLAMDKPKEALPYAKNALDLAITAKEGLSIESSYDVLYKTYKSIGDYKNALEAYEHSKNMREKIINTENNIAVATLQEKYETEKRQKEVIALTQKNKIQSLELEYQRFLRNGSILAALVGIIILIVFFHVRTTRLKTIYLEQKIQERTLEIEKQHQTIVKLLEHKERLLLKKNKLFSNISHEFRTPLTLIIGPIKRLLKNQNDTATQKILELVVFNANRLLRMVDQLLDLARLDLLAEKQSRSVDVKKTIEFILTSMQSLFIMHQLKINSDIEPELWIQISNDALEKILVNLLSNAVKYTHQGCAITITAWQNDEQVHISVRDNGIGIPLEEQSVIFDRFVRLQNHLSNSVPGAGVGLAIVKEMVERFEGTVSLNLDSNKGACFTLTFPVTQPSSSEPSKLPSQSTAMICEEEINAFRNKKSQRDSSDIDSIATDDRKIILVVEDNPDMSHFIAQGLSEHYHCLIAEDGRVGIRMALQEIPDLIITDLMMPNKSGFELAKTLREDFNTSHIPIIMLTAKGDTASRHEAWQLEIDEYFEKPFDDEELLLRCDNLLSIRQLISTKLREDLINQTTLNNEIKINSLINDRDRDFINKLEDYLHSHFSESTTNARLICRSLYMTDKQLQRKVKALLGQTIPEYVRNFRLKKGAELLKQEKNISTVAMSVGFSSQNYFSKSFSARYGMTPSEYQSHGNPDKL